LNRGEALHIAPGTLTKVYIVGHGGNEQNFLHLQGNQVNGIGTAIKQALVGLCADDCEFRVQICNAGNYPNPPFLVQVAPPGVTATAPWGLSYIDSGNRRRIDLVALVNFGVDQLHRMRPLLTKVPAIAANVSAVYGQLLTDGMRVAVVNQRANLNLPQDASIDAYYNHIAANANNLQTVVLFMSMPRNARFDIVNAARGGHTRQVVGV
jgi:hypothetical protein